MALVDYLLNQNQWSKIICEFRTPHNLINNLTLWNQEICFGYLLALRIYFWKWGEGDNGR